MSTALASGVIGMLASQARAVDPDADGLIAFASERRNGMAIYTMRPNGESTTLKRLGLGINPKWSRRGKRIAFVRQGDIFVMNADGSGVRNLTKSRGVEMNPSWSPDETKIAFASERKPHSRNFEIYIAYVDGSAPLRRLTVNPGEDRYPSWSPDGKRLAFQSKKDGKDQLLVINTDGTGRRILPTRGTSGSPAWSPDGTRLAFASDRDGNFEIYWMTLDGKSITRVTSDAGDEEFSDTDPVWAPDGEQIVFTSTRGGKGDLYVVSDAGEREGGSAKRLTTDDGEDTTSDWWPRPVGSFALLQRRVESGVVKITAKDTCEGDVTGTGFLVGTRFVATAAHVVRGAQRIVLSGRSMKPVRVTLHGIEAEVDVALLHSAKPLHGYQFSFASRAARQDDEVASFGYPEGATRISRRSGKVEEVSKVLLRVAPGLAEGNSGGPVVLGPSAPGGEAGDVIGLAFERDATTDETKLRPAAIVGSLVQRWRALKPTSQRC